MFVFVSQGTTDTYGWNMAFSLNTDDPNVRHYHDSFWTSEEIISGDSWTNDVKTQYFSQHPIGPKIKIAYYDPIDKSEIG